LIKVIIPKINKFSVDHSSLSCKIMEKTENGKYRLGSKFRIIKIYYSSGKLKPLEIATFPKLDKIPFNIITIRKAAYLQSIGLILISICNYKSKCSSNKYHCKKRSENCSNRCHSEHLYNNINTSIFN